MNTQDIEKYSSAITLSDMEIFVFPELMYSLLLANIMSPEIWSWREADCFKKIKNKSPYRKLLRLKQFIMDEFEFNLDLSTWGLTNKNTEMARFEKYIPADVISDSNALFGYHGDAYYFDLDIRKHFGLDEYDGDVIPYWKTETVEAMRAFRLKSGYLTGAGECVSLSAIYAAAAFIVCGIPLEDIYMVLTPLHSQNFLDINDGVITNNRRLVTKPMWFNGTELSNKAQRALKNEQITIISHSTGFTHCIYDEATIAENAFEKIVGKLSGFLTEKLETITLANFLRYNSQYQNFFQFCSDCHGNARFIKAETLFHYEHMSNFRIADATHEKLLREVDHEDYSNHAFDGRIRCDEFIEFMQKKKPDIETAPGRTMLTEFFILSVPEPKKFVTELYDFLHTTPKLPSAGKKFVKSEPLEITNEMDRLEVIEYLQTMREVNLTADLAFYTYRDMASCDWQPFIQACLQRSPVSIEMTKERTINDCYKWLIDMSGKSIYNDNRLAHPDEVANFASADGIEKAFTLANIIRSREPKQKMNLKIDDSKVILTADKDFVFDTSKSIHKTIEL